ncbi:E3 ubiquitin-protein ligase CCNB1IP1-like [Oopsacas minuta]|uniref:E3 ubiquitin-protein ligase CCNB1IP1-like n=1 Tax=Oopsacas minuta TaxID=111878 RepID=A0AAV7KEU6_9METZ|nr:E3 ubiquitin-protein ligase CCNB1IP1-like [Oopsacas minuta]
MESDLVCNFAKCRQTLGSFGWITSCSHVFCDEHGNHEFNRSANKRCPACKSDMNGKFNIVRADLHPSEEYKSMALAGQRPEVVMEICSRAIALWMYQSTQEKLYHEYSARQAKEKACDLEQYYEKQIVDTKTELNVIQMQLNGLRKDNEELKKNFNLVSDKLQERTRHCHKLQSQNDSLKRQAIKPGIFIEDDVTPPSQAAMTGQPSDFHFVFDHSADSHPIQQQFDMQPFRPISPHHPLSTLHSNTLAPHDANLENVPRVIMPFGTPPLDGEITKKLGRRKLN